MRTHSFRGYTASYTVVRIKDPSRLRAVVENLDRINAEVKPAEVQLLDAENILDEEHLKAAVVNAVMSFNGPNRVAKTLRMELLLRLSAAEQIREAIERLGVKPERTRSICVVALAENQRDAENALAKALGFLGETEEGEIPALEGERLLRIAKLYGVSEEELRATQARSYAEALRLAVIHRTATARLW